MANENPLPQPEDIPWQLMCVSNDMLDPNKCNKKFPMPWKSSIAISAYEPKEEDLPEPFCAGKITYLKITVSVTGYQPTDDEIEEGFTEFNNTPVEAALDDIFATYFGCYGALLNIAVFPNSATNWQLQDFPKIIAMEPQIRELVQVSTESGELLTASKGGMSTTNSYTNTNSTNTGVSGKTSGKATGKVDVPVLGEVGLESSSELGFTHSWGNTAVDSDQINANASQERSEKQSTSTQISQLYNLLSAYHLGTNRAVFFMLPRPHMLPPTNRRTFVQGVRSIEGIQEFFLIVSRPNSMEGICVEARLDTGHFPEDVEVKEPPVRYKESEIDFVLQKYAANGANNGAGPLNMNGVITSLDTIFPVPAGWYVDKRTTPPPFPKGDAGHVGITEIENGSNAQGAPFDYNYQATDTQIQITGKIQGANWFGSGAIFNKKYKVYLRSIDPIPSEIGEMANISDLFITSRTLCCCFYGGNPCLIKGVVPPTPVPPLPDEKYSKIVEQRLLSIPESLLSDPIALGSLEPAIKGLMRKLKGIMISSREHRLSHFEEGITFLDSDFFVKKILINYPDSVKNIRLATIRDLDSAVKSAYGDNGTVADALSDTLENFILKTKLGYRLAVAQRRIIINQIKSV